MASAPFMGDRPIERPDLDSNRLDESFITPYLTKHSELYRRHSGAKAERKASTDGNLTKDHILPTGTKMPHSISNGLHSHKRDPAVTNAYLVGGGIASLAAAAHLINDAQVPASQIHILESTSLPGGSMDGSGNPDSGYILRGGRMLNFSYLCLYDLLSTIPTLTNPGKTVMEEIHEFNQVSGNKTHANARIVAQGADGPEIVDVKKLGLSGKEKLDLVKMTLTSEKSLGTKKITDCFEPTFFHTNFWYMWSTMFAFQSWHSAVEFRRYLHRFLHEFPRINTLAGVDRTPFNQFDSIILPITKYLKAQGVDFRYGTKATGLSYAHDGASTVEEIHIIESGFTGIIHVHEHDIVICTLGSMTADSSVGSNTKAPVPLPSVPQGLSAPDGAWSFWDSISRDRTNFGNPLSFYSRVPESHWESFTVTLKTSDFLDRMKDFSHNRSGTGALVTFKDSNWLMSVVIPHQPHFTDQPEDVQVFWGYGLFTERPGNFVTKPMADCTGEEIMTELLGHLDFPLQPILENAVTIPCMLPYITSQFLTRAHDDRPKVIPEGSTNLAFIGQFVEIPEDVVFTVEYSVRGAQMAVFELMDLKKKPKSIYKGEHDPRVLAKVLEKFLF